MWTFDNAFVSRFRSRDAAMLAGAILAMAGLAAHAYDFPTWDAAFFEYAGRALVNGHTLYRDVWDNKLPSIFLIDAFWTVAFGQNYALHASAELLVDIVSVVLFARVLVVDRFVNWGPAAAVFGVALAVIGYPGDTEHYAVPLILAGVLFARGRRYALAGALFALAFTFWIPSVFTVLAVLAEGADRRFITLRSAVLGLVAIGLAMVAAFGVAICSELFSSWTQYVAKGGSLASRLADLRGNAPKLLIAAAPALFGLSVFGRLREPRARFAAGWFVAAFAGAFLPMHPWAHYFIPTLAASIYAMLAGGVHLGVRRSLVICGGLILLLLVWDMRSQRTAAAEAMRISRVADVLAAGLPGGAHIAIDQYEPGLFLATDAPLIDRFQLTYVYNMPFVHAVTNETQEQRTASYVAAADAVVIQGNPSDALYGGGRFVEVCATQVAPWHLLVRPTLARRFSRCASAGI